MCTGNYSPESLVQRKVISRARTGMRLVTMREKLAKITVWGLYMSKKCKIRGLVTRTCKPNKTCTNTAVAHSKAPRLVLNACVGWNPMSMSKSILHVWVELNVCATFVNFARGIQAHACGTQSINLKPSGAMVRRLTNFPVRAFLWQCSCL